MPRNIYRRTDFEIFQVHSSARPNWTMQFVFSPASKPYKASNRRTRGVEVDRLCALVRGVRANLGRKNHAIEMLSIMRSSINKKIK